MMIKKTHFMNAFMKSALCGCSVVLLSAGCTALGYRVGSTLPPGINVVHVPTFQNRTSEPQLELDTTQAVISEIQRDGTLTVGDMEKSDVVLSVELTGFTLEPLRYDSNTATTTQEYRMTIWASVILADRRANKVLVKTTVKGEADFEPVSDLSSAKRDAQPKAATDLAHQIVKSVVEFW